MIPLALGAGAAIAASAMRYPTSRGAFAIASALRVLAAGFLSLWVMGPSSGGLGAWPVVVFIWVSLAWTTFVGSGWPDYVHAWRADTGDSAGRPDRQAMPYIVTFGVGLPLSALAYGVTSWLFLTNFQREIDASGVGYGFSTTPALVMSLGICAFVAIVGAVALVIGTKKNPWYPAQAEYLRAASTRGSARTAAFRTAVSLQPESGEARGRGSV